MVCWLHSVAEQAGTVPICAFSNGRDVAAPRELISLEDALRESTTFDSCATDAFA